MIQAIIFDAGGVLLSEAPIRARLAEFDTVLGWEPGSLYLRLYSGPAWEAVSTGEIDVETFWAQVGGELDPLLPPDFPAYRDSFHGATLDTEMAALARRLREHYRIALLSNATPALRVRLAAEPDLRDLFEVAIISAEVGTRKPNPDIYRLTSARLGLPNNACLFIDDKARNTEAARDVGMQPILHTSAAETARALQAMGVVISR